MIPKSLDKRNEKLRRLACLLPGFKTAAVERQLKEIRTIFKRVFSTKDGRIVLNALLTDLHFFEPAESSADQALCEYAKFFLRERLDVSDTLAISNAAVDSALSKTEE